MCVLLKLSSDVMSCAKSVGCYDVSSFCIVLVLIGCFCVVMSTV